MDPITVTIVSAVAAGAAAGASEVATSAIKDAYTGLEAADCRRLPGNVAPFVDAVEADPGLEARTDRAGKDRLDQAGAAKDDGAEGGGGRRCLMP